MRLVRDGVKTTDEMARLLGLDDPSIVRRTVQDLLMRGAMNYGASRTLHVTDVIGERLLESALTKDERRFEGIQIWLDPLTTRVAWPDEAGLCTERDILDAGGTVMRPREALGSDALVRHFLDLHSLINAQPEPLAAHPLGEDVMQFELQHILPSMPKIRYRLAQLELSRHSEGEWTYRLIVHGEEDLERAGAMRIWETDGHPVVPLSDPPRSHPSTQVNALLDGATRAAAQGSTVADPDAAREAMREAIQAARTTIQVMPGIGDLDFTDDLPIWLEQALHDTRDLKVLVGVDPGFLKGLGSASAGHRGRRLSQAYQRLRNKYQQDSRLSLVEMRAVPCRIVVIDKTRVLLQLREFQPYSGGKGLSRSILIDQVPTNLLEELQQLLAELVVR